MRHRPAPRHPSLLPAAMLALLALMLAPLAAAAPPPAQSPSRAPAPIAGSGWGSPVTGEIEEATSRHVRILRNLAQEIEGRQELERIRSQAAMARETAARALRSPSANEMRAAREVVRDAFRQSQVSVGRMASSLGPGEAARARKALERLQAQQQRALHAFDRALGEARSR